MKTKDTSGFITITGIIIAVGRLLLGNISDDVILIVMALVNYIALGFVFLFINIDIKNICIQKIYDSGLSTPEKSRAYSINTIFSAVLLIIYCIGGIWYIAELKSSNLNDAMSIVALTLSIASNGLAEILSPLYYKTLSKMAKYKRKSKGT